MSITPAIRPYYPTSTYHIFNRGAHRNVVFKENKDFWIFKRIIREVLHDYQKDIHLRCYCILPNHYHMLLYQKKEWQISKIMKSIGIRYARFFNRKYKLSGQVFETEYQCIYLPTEEDILRVERYILSNPLNAGQLSWKHVGTKV